MGWVIVLLGAQVAYAHQYIRFYEGEREFLTNSLAGREKLALQIMYLIGRNFYQGRDPLSITALANQLYVPEGLVKDFTQTFHHGRLVLPVANEETFVLARDPERISIKEILDCVRNSGVKKPAVRTDEEVAIEELLQKVDNSVAQTLEGKSLQSLIVEHNRTST